MAKFWHQLRPNITNVEPRNWCFVDTEANISIDKHKVQTHSLRLGVACYSRDATDSHDYRESWCNFKTKGEFWDWILDESEKDRKLCIIAYNMGYDVRILDAFHELESRGFEQKSVYAAETKVIISFKKGRQKVELLDAMNWFDGKLEQWGDMLDIPKLEIDFDNTDDASLFTYCERDTLILKRLIEKWREFRDEHDIGQWSPTKASQAFNCFRHRFMPVPIVIHADFDAIQLERDSYCGGRVEAYHIGELEGEKFTQLDINSLYPYIMATTKVPTKLLGVIENYRAKALSKRIEGKDVVGVCHIKTDKPIYPVKLDGKLVWPVGEFITTLATSEIREAIKREHLVRFVWGYLYNSYLLFRDYVRYFYPVRMKYKREGNKIYEAMVKYLLNTLYGKWGAFSHNWKKGPRYPYESEGAHEGFDRTTGLKILRYVIGNVAWEARPRGEARDSFVAIASCITSAARMHLYHLIERAGAGNVFYTDTDSLLVNTTGLIRLAAEIDPTRLGKLKVEAQADRITIYGAKDYEIGDKKRLKGITKDATLNVDGRYEQDQWESLRGAFRTGNLNKVVVKPITKGLARNYSKGLVDSSGSVSPLLLELDEARN